MLKELNQKYIHPSVMCFAMRKPLFKNIKIKDKQSDMNQDSYQNSPDKISCSKITVPSPLKANNMLSENDSNVNILDDN